jgi:hypothetical protein
MLASLNLKGMLLTTFMSYGHAHSFYCMIQLLLYDPASTPRSHCLATTILYTIVIGSFISVPASWHSFTTVSQWHRHFTKLSLFMLAEVPGTVQYSHAVSRNWLHFYLWPAQ